MFLTAGLFLAGTVFAQNDSSATQDPSTSADRKQEKSSNQLTTKLKIQVAGNDDKPVANASVYVRYELPGGGLLHHDKVAELDLKTSAVGSVKVPEVPQGKVLIQVIAKGWKTYGKWYDIEEVEETIQIKLETPPRWY